MKPLVLPSDFGNADGAVCAMYGVAECVGYAVSIALRYIPDIQRDYHSISQAQQARGVELGKKETWNNDFAYGDQRGTLSPFGNPLPKGLRSNISSRFAFGDSPLGSREPKCPLDSLFSAPSKV